MPDPESVADDKPATDVVEATEQAAEQAAEPATAATNAMTPAEVAAKLKSLFPGLFVGYKPLKLRVQADIQARAPGEFTKAQLSAFLRRHTGSTGYLIASVKATHRFDLDGQPAEELSEEHRKVAQDELTRRRNLQREREDLAEQQYRNRAQLLHDFERTTLTEPNFCALKGVAPEELAGLLEIARKEAAARPPELQRREGGRPGRPEGRNDQRRDQRPRGKHNAR